MNYKKIWIRVFALMLVLSLLSGCNILGKDEEPPAEEPTQATDEGEDTTVTTEKSDETTKKPDNTTKPNPDDKNDTPTPPANDKIKIACAGDSLTYGNGFTDRAYPIVLQELLGNGYEVRNFGAGGRTATEGLSDDVRPDRSYNMTQKYRDSIAYAADIAVICLGTNDCFECDLTTDAGKQAYINGMKNLIAAYRAAGAKHVYACLPPYGSQATLNAQVGTILVPLVRQVVQECNTKLIDLYTVVQQNPSLLQTDGIHLTAEGYAAMANAVYQTISKQSGGSVTPSGSLTVTDKNTVQDIYSFVEKFDE